jgi:type I restriction enzyme S subunit
MSEGNGLPTGWAEATIEGLVGNGVFCDGDWVESEDQDPNGDVRLIQLADVGDGEYRDRSSRFLTSAKATELHCTFLEAGDVLIARMPDPLGRGAVFPGDTKKSVTVVDVCVVRSSPEAPFHHKWLMHFVNAPVFRVSVASLQSGSTRKRISRKNLATLTLPVPPLPEQHRIVEKIEELFSDLDAGVASLERAMTYPP